MLENRKPTEIATDLYFLAVALLLFISFIGAIPLAATQSEVMALGLFYSFAVTVWFIIYRFFNRGVADEYS
jgi:hypothetical protein